MTTRPSSASSERSAETRGRILGAALTEFSAHGLAGARMDKIAGAASVNKALLYYYYDSKEKLYDAALEMISAKIRDRTMAVFVLESSPGERLLYLALDHFDRIMTQHEFQRLMQQEMIRLHQGESAELPIIVKRVFAPVQAMYQSLVREGIESGELIHADWLQIQLAALGANVVYFMSAPVWRILLPFDPLAPEVLAERRKELVGFLGQAMFADRQHGAELAARVLANSPMPEVDSARLKLLGRKDERAQ